MGVAPGGGAAPAAAAGGAPQIPLQLPPQLLQALPPQLQVRCSSLYSRVDLGPWIRMCACTIAAVCMCAY